MPLSRLFRRSKGTEKLSPKQLAENIPETQNLVDHEPYGLLELAKGDNPVVDIVAVHGLNGHRERTWTADNGVNWLQALLPEKIRNARIFSWGYDANTHSNSPISVQYLYDHATQLVSDLALERQLSETEQRPIIFIAHSLGGIVVKSALIHSELARKDVVEQHAIKLSTYGLIFLGTPHQGGEGVAWGERLVAIASIFVQTNKMLLQHLQRDSEWLQLQLNQYLGISDEFVTRFAYETLPTAIPLGKSIVVVPKSSAVVPGAKGAGVIAINRDHRTMVRFSTAEDTEFRKIWGTISVMVRTCAGKIKENWENRDIVENGK